MLVEYFNLYQSDKCLEHHESKSQYHDPKVKVLHSNCVHLLFFLSRYLERNRKILHSAKNKCNNISYREVKILIIYILLPILQKCSFGLHISIADFKHNSVTVINRLPSESTSPT